jgi:RND superfamily putative drug exporter
LWPSLEGRQRRLFTVHFHVYASADYVKRFGEPKSLEDLDNHRLVSFGGDQPSYLMSAHWLSTAGRDGREGRAVHFVVNNIVALHAAVESGFVASSRVVVAAAVIMLGVFGGFVPEGDGAIKTIGFGLAVGVFVDAFVVRMTLVPAVLTLLGTRAWWLPRWIDRRLPSFDVEGEGLAHQVALAQWPAPDDRHLIVAEGLRVGDFDDVAPSVLPGEVLVVEGPTATEATALLLMLSGRMPLRVPAPGRTVRARTAGLVLPEQAGRVRRRTAYVDCASDDLPRVLAELARTKPDVLFLDHVDALTDPGGDPDARAALARTFDAVAASGTSAAVVAASDRSALETLLRGPSRVLDLRHRPALAQA